MRKRFDFLACFVLNNDARLRPSLCGATSARCAHCPVDSLVHATTPFSLPASHAVLPSRLASLYYLMILAVSFRAYIPHSLDRRQDLRQELGRLGLDNNGSNGGGRANGTPPRMVLPREVEAEASSSRPPADSLDQNGIADNEAVSNIKANVKTPMGGDELLLTTPGRLPTIGGGLGDDGDDGDAYGARAEEIGEDGDGIADELIKVNRECLRDERRTVLWS